MICSLQAFTQSKKDLSVGFMLRGHIYALSSIADTTALGGFAESDNLPKQINASLNFPQKGLFLMIDTTIIVTINKKFNGYKFYIGNNSDTIVQLQASDSRLYAIAEVYYENKWQPIEYLPSSSCGNSFHLVFLKPNEYWSFDIPKFKGSVKTKLRYRLMVGDNKFIYSNEIATTFNKSQLKEKQEYNPNGIMDPYED